MGRSTPIHRLTEVDKTQCTAICSTCGPTRIYVTKPDKDGRVRVYCFQKRRQIENEAQRRLRQKRRLQNPNWKPRHLLREIDKKNMTAVCSICGPTDIRKRTVEKYTIYICATKKRAYAQDYRRSHYRPHPRKPKPSQHSLSEVDYENMTAICSQCGQVRMYLSRGRNGMSRRCGKVQNENLKRRYWNNKRFINWYKVKHGCKGCGYNANSLRLELHCRARKEKDGKTWLLAKLGRERLLQELQKSDVYCIDCHRDVHSDVDLHTK